MTVFKRCPKSEADNMKRQERKRTKGRGQQYETRLDKRGEEG